MQMGLGQSQSPPTCKVKQVAHQDRGLTFGTPVSLEDWDCVYYVLTRLLTLVGSKSSVKFLTGLTGFWPSPDTDRSEISAFVTSKNAGRSRGFLVVVRPFADVSGSSSN